MANVAPYRCPHCNALDNHMHRPNCRDFIVHPPFVDSHTGALISRLREALPRLLAMPHGSIFVADVNEMIAIVEGRGK